MAEALSRQMAGKAPDDFVFTTRTGRPLHNGDFYNNVWGRLMAALKAECVAPFRFHDLRHTHVAWLVAGGAPLPYIQARLGHESITTTIDTYGHLLPAWGRADLRHHRHRPDRRHDPARESRPVTRVACCAWRVQSRARSPRRPA